MSEFQETAGDPGDDPQVAGQVAPTPSEPARDEAGGDSAGSGSSVAAVLAELDTLGHRELSEHPDVYQRIHAELQSALATIDNA